MSSEDLSADELTLPIKRHDDPDASVTDRMTDNAVQNIMPARYLRKDVDGNIVEDVSEVFERVAKNVALAEAIYAAEQADTTITVTPEQIKHTHSRRGEIAGQVFGYDASEFADLDAFPDDLETARPHLLRDEVQLTEDNVRYFAYDTVVPELPDAIRSTVTHWKGEFQELMERLAWMPNSPTIMNAGNELQQLSACFVDSPTDDNVDIHETITEASQIFKTGGGVGYDWSKLRPYGDAVGSTGGIASGPLTFMQTADQMCETIAQGGVRRGAQMANMHVTHPDVIEFIHAKRKAVSLARTLKLNDPDDFTHTKFSEALEEARELIDDEGRVPEHLRNAVEGHLSNFNISVTVTDEFLAAKDNGDTITMINPRTAEPHIATQKTKEMYSRYGLGDQVEVGKALEIDARTLWERICEGAHENGEPGVIHISEVNRQHSFPADPDAALGSAEYNRKEFITATNPCGEEPLMEYDACNLGHINLSTLAATNAPDWRAFSDTADADALDARVEAFLEKAIDWDRLNRRIETGTRFLDNVVTMSDFPIEQIDETVGATRKVGLGIMGLAQLYIQLGVQYGSEVGNEVARQLMTHINHESKRVSRDLAEERGTFDWWDDSKFADPTAYPDWFERHVGADPEDWADGYPMRNYNTTTIAPTGTTSMLANTSGGCEPIYDVAFFKNVSDDVQGDEMLVEFDDYFLRALEANDIDVEAVQQEAVELMSNNEWVGVESLDSVPEEIAELFVTTQDLSAIEHASIQCALQQGVDAAISKTVNAPNDATLADTKEAFDYVLRNGGKGVTYYRDGTRAKQVKTTRAQNQEFADEAEAAETIAEQIDATFGGLATFLNREEVKAVLDEDLAELRQLQTEATAVARGDLPEDAVCEINEEGYVEVRSRPDVLHGVTQRIDTGYGKLYVNINEDDQGRPFELFANIGNSGGFTASFTESLAKTISTALRSGIDPEEIADELQGIRSPKVAWDKGEQIQSIPDAIGTAMRRYLDGEIDKGYPQQRNLTELQDAGADAEGAPSQADVEHQTDGGAATQHPSTDTDTDEVISAGESPECPECGSMALYYSEGCKTCEACGWSEC